MILIIPILTLLDSQLDIRVDPRSGNFTYNIKDAPSSLQYGYAAGNLMLTLQSSAGDAGSIICLRICTSSTVDSAHQSVSQDFEVAAAPARLACQSDQHRACSAEMSAPSIPDVYRQGSFSPSSGYKNPDGANDPYSIHSKNAGPKEPVVYQASPWEVPREKSPPPSMESNLMSPISKTLSLITSGSIFGEDSTSHGSLGFSGYSDLQYSNNTDYIHGHPAHSYSSEFTIDMTDGRAFDECGELSASCASLPTTYLSGFGSASVQNSALPQHLVSSLASSGVATSIIKDGQSVEPRAKSSSSIKEVSSCDAFPTASASISDGYTSESRPQSREGKNDGYPCQFETCGRALKSLHTQQLHMKTHAPKPRKNFPCMMGCSESFTRHHDRLRHEVSQHGKQCEYSCKRCNRFFSSQRMLGKHTCWSSRIGPLRWQLKDCGDSSSET